MDATLCRLAPWGKKPGLRTPSSGERRDETGGRGWGGTCRNVGAGKALGVLSGLLSREVELSLDLVFPIILSMEKLDLDTLELELGDDNWVAGWLVTGGWGMLSVGRSPGPMLICERGALARSAGDTKGIPATGGGPRGDTKGYPIPGWAACGNMAPWG